MPWGPERVASAPSGSLAEEKPQSRSSVTVTTSLFTSPTSLRPSLTRRYASVRLVDRRLHSPRVLPSGNAARLGSERPRCAYARRGTGRLAAQPLVVRGERLMAGLGSLSPPQPN